MKTDTMIRIYIGLIGILMIIVVMWSAFSMTHYQKLREVQSKIDCQAYNQISLLHPVIIGTNETGQVLKRYTIHRTSETGFEIDQVYFIGNVIEEMDRSQENHK